jgi:hypothetical protein
VFAVLVIACYTKQINILTDFLTPACQSKPFVSAFVKLRRLAVSNVFDLSRWVLMHGFYGCAVFRRLINACPWILLSCNLYFSVSTVLWLWVGGEHGLATGWTVRGSNLGGERCLPRVQTGPGAHPASCTVDTKSFLRVKRPGRGVDHPPDKGKGRVELYIYSPSGPSWPILGRTLSLLVLFYD